MPDYVPFTRQFPPELIGCIIKSFDVELLREIVDRHYSSESVTRDLENLAKANPAWERMVQQTLISVLYVDEDIDNNLDVLMERYQVKKNSTLLGFVRSVRYAGEGFGQGANGDLDGFIGMMTKLREVEFARSETTLKTIDSFPRTLTRLILKETLIQLAAEPNTTNPFPNLRQIGLDTCAFRSSTIEHEQRFSEGSSKAQRLDDLCYNLPFLGPGSVVAEVHFGCEPEDWEDYEYAHLLDLSILAAIAPQVSHLSIGQNEFFPTRLATFTSLISLTVGVDTLRLTPERAQLPKPLLAHIHSKLRRLKLTSVFLEREDLTEGTAYRLGETMMDSLGYSCLRTLKELVVPKSMEAFAKEVESVGTLFEICDETDIRVIFENAGRMD